MVLLWFAGYLTSALTSCAGMLELRFREGILSRLVKEQDGIIETFAGGEREVTYEQIVSKMPLLDAYNVFVRNTAIISGYRHYLSKNGVGNSDIPEIYFKIAHECLLSYLNFACDFRTRIVAPAVVTRSRCPSK